MTHYQILGVSEDATLNEIKEAYRKLALRYHPDKNPDDLYSQNKFIEVGKAYEILSNYEKRTEYDNRQKGSNHSFEFDMLQPMRFDSTFQNMFQNLSQMNSFDSIRSQPNYSKSVSVYTTNVNGKQKTRKVTVENGKKKVEEYEGFEPGNQQMINYN